MPTIERATGVQVTVPDRMAVADEPLPGRRRGSSRDVAPPVTPAPLEGELVAALRMLDLELVDAIPITTLEEPSDPIGRRRRGAPSIPPTQDVTFATPVTAGEQAVALVEQDGVYAWSFGTLETEPAPGDVRRRGPSDAAVAETRTIRFSVQIHASSSPTRRTRLFGVDRVFRPFTAFVFKFPAKLIVGQVVKRLENDIATGLIHLGGPSVSSWRPLKDPAELKLPKTRSPRVLLLIHGTFSSTAGAFGALGLTPTGKEFMKQTESAYDAVLGFDHRTLSVDPVENADELLAELRKLSSRFPLTVDVISHSRGGLVYRSLVEHVIPAEGWDGTFGNAVFVAAPNAGTEFADPSNWHRLIDLYTNLAVAGLNALGTAAPQAKAVTTILSGLLRGLAAFVRALATTAVDDTQVPGLAAMEPDGAFVRTINETQPGQPRPGMLDYYAVTSNFDPSFADEGTIPAKLKRFLTDGFVDQLIGEDNDLVVDVDSMTAIDPHEPGHVTDVLSFGSNGIVHHTNYFQQESTVAALGHWLSVDDPLARQFGGVPGAGGATPRSSLWSPYIEPNFVLLESTLVGEEVRRLMRTRATPYVIVRRSTPFEVYHYAYSWPELGGLMQSQTPLAASLDLHEHTSSPETSAADVDGFVATAFDAAFPTRARSVVTRGAEIVGVVPNVREMVFDMPELALPGVTYAEPEEAAPPPPPRPRRRLRGPAPTARNGEVPEPYKARRFFRGQMPGEVVVEQTASIEVTVSQEQLDVAAGRIGRSASVEIDTTRPIVIHLVPRLNFDLVGEGRAEIDPLTGPEPVTRYFDVLPTDVGAGEIDIVIRQGQVPLLTMKLTPTIVAKRSPGPQTLAVAEGAATDAPSFGAPVHQLTIWEHASGAKIRLTFAFESESLNERCRVESEPIKGGIKGYVADVYEKIEETWASRAHTQETFTKDLQAIGMTMFEELVPLAMRELLWRHRESILNIQVLSNEPYVPWEIVHLKKPGGRAQGEWFLGQLGVVRWLENIADNGFPPSTLEIKTAKAIIPDYPPMTDWELLAPAREFKYLESKFRATKIPSTRTDVDAALAQPGTFDLLHYAGHGEAPAKSRADAELILSVKARGNRWIKQTVSATTVEQFASLSVGGRRPMVVLNACQVGRMQRRLAGLGGFAKAFLTAGAGVFVSSLWSVGDEPARFFVEAFYDELHNGKTISEATVQAREAARNAGDLTWLAYVVYANPHARLVT